MRQELTQAGLCAAGEQGLCRGPLREDSRTLFEYLGDHHHRHCWRCSLGNSLLGAVVPMLSGLDMLWLLLLPIAA